MAHDLERHYRPFAHTDSGDLVEPAADLRRIACLVGAVLDQCVPCIDGEREWTSSPEGMVVLDRFTNWIITRDDRGMDVAEVDKLEAMKPELREKMAASRLVSLALHLGPADTKPAAKRRPTRTRVGRPGQRKRKKK